MDNSLHSFPKVSIIIPTFRQEACIKQAVTSALAQQYPNLEIIVVDDASPDNTARVVAECRDPRLRYVRNEYNLGRVRNYRRALYELVSGEWVVNLDGDDYFIDPDFIGSAVQLAYSEPDIVIVSAKRKVVTPFGTREPLRQPTTVLPGTEVLMRYIDERYHLSHMATMYNRPRALTCEFYRMDVISSDWESLLRLALTGKVAYLDRVVGCWMFSGNNASVNSNWKALSDNLMIWPAIYREAAMRQLQTRRFRHARNMTLLRLAYRDIGQILRGGAVLAVFKYMRHGFPVLKTAVIMRLIAHPYIWAKIFINIFNIIMKRIPR